MLRSPLLWTLLLVAACSSPRTNDAARDPLPARWNSLEPIAFEELLATLDDRVEPKRWRPTPAARGTLAAALQRMDTLSVRAALLLSRDPDPAAAAVILGRLESRDEGPERHSDSGDVVAAASLARRSPDQRPPDLVPRLRDLAVGSVPHPDLEVRVECAGAALALGDDAVIPFLLQVLRIDTWVGQDDPRDFVPSHTTTWARSRAAEALSRRAGVPVTYHPDSSILDRERESARLEALLAEAGESPAPGD